MSNSINSPSKIKQYTGGSLVYGAQHPPLKQQQQQQITANKNDPNYVEFDNKTLDAWDIQVDDDLEEFRFEALKISVQTSDEMAKKVIQKHNEKQKQKIIKNGPGKALRQEMPIIKQEQQDKQLEEEQDELKVKQIVDYKLVEPQLERQLSNKEVKLNLVETNTNSNIKMDKFELILNAQIQVNLEDLQKTCWKGIPKKYRPKCWKLLSDYLPLNIELQEKTIEQKRNSYWDAVNEHYTKAYVDTHHDILRQIMNDIPRMNPLMPIFQNQQVQDIFQRILYVWSVRHPASGYVQGINDLVTPFFAVFITEYLNNNDNNIDLTDIADNFNIESINENDLRKLEADCYGCMTKLLDKIQENYIFSQPGIQKKVISLEEIIKRMNIKLHMHLKQNNIEYLQFSFRWMNNLLMRELPLKCTIRLWDTYHAEPFGFSDFHLYVCAAFLLKFSNDILKQKDFQDLMIFLQNLPTKNWTHNDIIMLTAEAYKLQVMFANHHHNNHR
jgi:TBC1 domain family member 2